MSIWTLDVAKKYMHAFFRPLSTPITKSDLDGALRGTIDSPPLATKTNAGVVKIGSNLDINSSDGTLSVNAAQIDVRILKPPIASISLINTVYPNPQGHWTVRCLDTGYVYEYDSNAHLWKHIETIVSNGVQLRVPYAPVVAVTFDSVASGGPGYAFPPVIVACLTYDPTTTTGNDGSLPTVTYDMIPVVSMTSAKTNDTLYYTGFKVHFVGPNVPETLADTYVNIISIVREG
jgi:hypothetical protein